MNKNLQALDQVIRANPALQAQLKAATSEQEFIERTVQLGKANGIDLSAADVKASIQEAQAQAKAGPKGELSDPQLESVAGGAITHGWGCTVWYHWSTSGYFKCS